MPLTIKELVITKTFPNLSVTVKTNGIGFGQVIAELYLPGDTAPRETVTARAFGISPQPEVTFKTISPVGDSATVKVKLAQGIGLFRTSEPVTKTISIAVHPVDDYAMGG